MDSRHSRTASGKGARPFAACASPRPVTRLTDGRHEFRVRATDAAGNVDPSAARDRFRVLG